MSDQALRDAICDAVVAERLAENPQLSQFSGTVNSRFVDRILGLVAERIASERAEMIDGKYGYKHGEAVGYARALADAEAAIEATCAEWRIQPEREYPWSEREDEFAADVLAVVRRLAEEDS